MPLVLNSTKKMPPLLGEQCIDIFSWLTEEKPGTEFVFKPYFREFNNQPELRDSHEFSNQNIKKMNPLCTGQRDIISFRPSMRNLYDGEIDHTVPMKKGNHKHNKNRESLVLNSGIKKMKRSLNDGVFVGACMGSQRDIDVVKKIEEKQPKPHVLHHAIANTESEPREPVYRSMLAPYQTWYDIEQMQEASIHTLPKDKYKTTF